MEAWLLDNGWIVALLWGGLYASDFYLTIWAARVYDRGAKEHISFSGSYELNPLFHEDVDSRRWVSRRFLTLLGIYAASMIIIWFFTVFVLGVPELFKLYAGAMFLMEVPVHLRHVRNLVLFYSSLEAGMITGRIAYSRRLAFKVSAVESLAFAVFFGLLSASFGSWFLAGGALVCLSTAHQHRRWMKQLPAQVEMPEQACA